MNNKLLKKWKKRKKNSFLSKILPFNSVLAASNFSWSAESTTKLIKLNFFFFWNEFEDCDFFKRERERKVYTIAFTPLQYLSHIDLNLGCPPISHNFMVTFPLVILRILNPTVGIISSVNDPFYIIIFDIFYFFCDLKLFLFHFFLYFFSKLSLKKERSLNFFLTIFSKFHIFFLSFILFLTILNKFERMRES